MELDERWLILADARRARLFRAERLRGSGIRVRALRTIENHHERERHRPALGGGVERASRMVHGRAHAAPQSLAVGHAAEEEIERFASEVSHWLVSVRSDLGEGRLVLFAPPRFLGALRRHVKPAEAVELREGDFARLSEGELCAHPVVVSAMTGP